MDLTDLYQKVKDIKAVSKDYVVEGKHLRAQPLGPKELSLDVSGLGSFQVGRFCHEQIAEKAGIPLKYYQRMLENGATQLLSDNVNRWLPDKERRMIRTLAYPDQPVIRALVSSKFRALDNFDLLQSSMEVFQEYRNTGHSVNIAQAYMTDTGFYLKAITDRREAIKKDDVVEAGVIIRNSEVGRGSLRVEPYVNRLYCMNGAIVGTYKRFHIGGDKGMGHIWSEITRNEQDKLIWLEVRDIVGATLKGEFLDQYVQEQKGLIEIELEKPLETVRAVVERQGCSKEEMDAIINSFVKEKDTTAYGAVNAITSIAKFQDIERQMELEEMGFRVGQEFLGKIDVKKTTNIGSDTDLIRP